ncbi:MULTISPECIES: transposase [Clostridium]|uniref:transposase n=1 Tax=Clostridium TaxID=1485 RepID=UPI00036FEDE1|nr:MULTISPECIES: transposase [Clostridium]NRT59698.1 hypothetical protein [Clostridium saccharoperbutylacetonicum]NSB28891.1 hypothetical protein [Clostridium saccharoperbutylacetonicum]NSB34090.1 hypothetical protein [Clostridium saccharoperbutylacetonicum]
MNVADFVLRKELSLDSEELFLINTPKYSLVLNTQENIWNKLKNCIFSTSDFISIDELFDSVNSI